MINNRGQTMGIAILSAVFIFIIGMMIINFVMPEVTTTRAELDCANAAGISDGTKVLCLVVDTVVIYWILTVFSVLSGIIIGRLSL